MELIFGHPLRTFLFTAFFFLLLYFGASFLVLGLKKLARRRRIGLLVAEEASRAQVFFEIRHSLLSIFVFALMALPVQYWWERGWFVLSFSNDWFEIFWQTLVLFLWNELHFFIVHRSLHIPYLFRKVHYVHHRSLQVSVFSTYSFHWLEAFLLGSVAYFPMLVFDFEWLALGSLPVFSILLNAFGHLGYDFFGNGPVFLRFATRHSAHHRRSRVHFGFFLPILDQLFNTSKDGTKR